MIKVTAATMTTRVARVMIGLVAVATMAGCSSGRHERTIGAARVEPELSAAATRRGAGPVPVVIAPARPFHTKAGAGSFAAPRRLPSGLVGTDAATATRHEVEAALADYLRAFNRHDTADVVSHWSEQGENVDLDSGATTAGRDAVGAVFRTLFASDDEATIDIDVQAVRPVRRDVAVVDGTSTVRFGDGSRAGSRFSAVMVRHDGRWLLEQVREASRPLDDDHEGRPLDQLTWLVGAWENTVPGATASTRCFWSAGRGFLVRTHAVTTAATVGPVDADIPALLPATDAVDRELTEIIGWDPERQTIRSWVFTSSGRFAEGTWIREGDRWKVRVDGRGSDEGRTADYVVTRRGADAISVDGPRDGLAAELVPVGDVVRAAR